MENTIKNGWFGGTGTPVFGNIHVLPCNRSACSAILALHKVAIHFLHRHHPQQTGANRTNPGGKKLVSSFQRFRYSGAASYSIISSYSQLAVDSHPIFFPPSIHQPPIHPCTVLHANAKHTLDSSHISNGPWQSERAERKDPPRCTRWPCVKV